MRKKSKNIILGYHKIKEKKIFFNFFNKKKKGYYSAYNAYHSQHVKSKKR